LPDLRSDNHPSLSLRIYNVIEDSFLLGDHFLGTDHR
jgi:hypothetical protein